VKHVVVCLRSRFAKGNHGEDCKECYYYLDSTPTHSYMKALYKYPQRRFPYSELVEQNRTRSRNQPEFELSDTGGCRFAGLTNLSEPLRATYGDDKSKVWQARVRAVRRNRHPSLPVDSV